MSEEEKYALELTIEEMDALITYLQYSPDLVNAKKTNLIVGEITHRLIDMRARTLLKR